MAGNLKNMDDKICKLLKNTAARLIFALLSGVAYFTLIYRFVLAHTDLGGRWLAWSFCPLIICGAALVIIRLLKQAEENENKQGISALFVVHVILMVMAAVSALAMRI